MRAPVCMASAGHVRERKYGASELDKAYHPCMHNTAHVSCVVLRETTVLSSENLDLRNLTPSLIHLESLSLTVQCEGLTSTARGFCGRQRGETFTGTDHTQHAFSNCYFHHLLLKFYNLRRASVPASKI